MADFFTAIFNAIYYAYYGNIPSDLVEIATFATMALGGLLILWILIRLIRRMFRRKEAAPKEVETGASASGLTPGAMEELERVQALLKQGTISHLEFERLKAKIIKM